MESIGALIWIIIVGSIVSSFVKKAKQQQKAAEEQKKKQPAKPIPGQMTMEQLFTAPKVEKYPDPVRFSGSIPEGTDPCHESDLGGPDRMKSSLYGGSLGTYTGSLGTSTYEGIDPCHDDQAAAMTSLEISDLPDEDAKPGLKFSWEGNEVLKAVVMQEILKRPCAR